MIHDMEEYAHYENPYDELNILSEHPNPDHKVEGQIVNVVVPQGFQGELYNNIGDHFTYCITSPSTKRLGNLRYKANSC